MTILWATSGESTIQFETDDDFPHVSEHNIGDSFHLFRATEKPATTKVICRLLKFAIDYCEELDEITYALDYPDIINHKYEKQSHFGIKVSCFEMDNYIIGVTILVPSPQGNKND